MARTIQITLDALLWTVLSPIHMRKKYTRVNILRCVFILRCANQSESKFKLRSHGFYRQSIFVGKFISSRLKPVHLSFLYLQNKKRLLQGVHVDFGSRGESCNGQA